MEYLNFILRKLTWFNHLNLQMGNWCAGTLENDKNSIMLSSKSKLIVDNAKRNNNFHLILRVQTIMRSYLATKRAAKIKTERGMVGSGAPRAESNYHNEVVEQIFNQLGPYDYAMAKNVVYDENIIMKGWRTLENGGNLNFNFFLFSL